VVDRLCKLESNLDGFGGAGWLLVEGAVCKLRTLLLRKLLDISASGKLGVVGDD
jgi:hypothetical protein